MGRAAAGIALALAAACGDNSGRPAAAADAGAHPDAGVPSVVEAEDCGGAAMVPRSGAALAASSFRIPAASESLDLDGDQTPDNQLSAFAFDAQLLASALAGGTLAIPLELFDRGADPDPCVKLALYRGACAAAPCDFTDDAPDAVALDAASIDGGAPVSRLRAMRSVADGTLALSGPGYLELEFPFRVDFTGSEERFVFPLTVTRASGSLTPTGLSALHVAGVVQAFRLAQLAAPVSSDLGTRAGDSALDAIFANVLGGILALPRNGRGCARADVDVDGDGLEAFCDSRDDAVFRVDTCIDGNGVELRDGDNGVADCSQAMKLGRPRFADGISAQVVLSAKPAVLAP